MPGGAMTVPQGGATVPSTLSPSGTAPADQVPSLSPSGFQGSFQSSTSRNYSTPTTGSARAVLSIPPTLSRESFSKPPSDNLLKALPDLDAVDSDFDPSYEAPQLLDPRDKTASSPVQKPWTYSPIKLATATSDQNAAEQKPLSAEPKRQSQFDASGWRSIAK
jgi:hypothetical protein